MQFARYLQRLNQRQYFKWNAKQFKSISLLMVATTWKTRLPRKILRTKNMFRGIRASINKKRKLLAGLRNSQIWFKTDRQNKRTWPYRYGRETISVMTWPRFLRNIDDRGCVEPPGALHIREFSPRRAAIFYGSAAYSKIPPLQISHRKHPEFIYGTLFYLYGLWDAFEGPEMSEFDVKLCKSLCK